MRVKPGLPVLWRSPSEAQIGVDPRFGVRLAGLGPADHELLTSLERDVHPEDLARRARALDVLPGRVLALVEVLRRAGVLLEHAGPAWSAQAPPEGVIDARWAADAATWSLLRADGTGPEHLAARRRAHVVVIGMDRVGLGVCRILAAAGVGTLTVCDTRPVTGADLGEDGYPRDLLALPRERAAAELLEGTTPAPRVVAGRPQESWPPGAPAVVVERLVADPCAARRLMRMDVAHLSVVLRAADALVGPFVHPGGGPCLRCLDLHRSDADPRWPAVATQLRLRRAEGPGPETVLADVVAGLAAGQTLAEVDGFTPTTLRAGLEVALPEAVPARREWQVHPRCGCTGPPPTG